MYSGQALLYVVSVEEYDEQGHRGTWLEAGNIAETGKTVVNWYHDADYKINLSKCGELYAKAIQAARAIPNQYIVSIKINVGKRKACNFAKPKTTV